MKSFLRTYLLLCFAMSMAIGHAQQMYCVGHVDKPIYVTGEVIWFDVVLPDFLQGQEFSVRTSIHRQDGRAVDQFFIKSGGEPNLAGYYKIPFDFSAGLYRLHLAVHSGQTNADESLLTMTVPIYNDLKSAPSNLRLSETADDQDELSKDLQITFDQGGSSGNSEVTSTIIIKDAQGQPIASDLSLSLTDQDILSGLAYTRTTFRGSDLDRFNLQNLENAVFVKGRVIHQDRDEPVKLNVFGGYSGTDNRIYYTGTNEDGRFLMKIPDYTGEKPIQFMGYQREEDRIRVNLDRPSLPPLASELRYTEQTMEYMNWSRMRKKIYQYYGAVESPIRGEEIIPEPQELEPNSTYIIDEYESFETVSAFFNELMAALTFVMQDDSTYRASMYNPSGRIAKNTYLSGDPLFIIDDKATRDAHFVAQMSASPIETIELFLQPRELLKTFQALGISGVVRIKTKLRDIEVPADDAEEVFRIQGLQAKAQFPSRLDIENSEMPIFSSAIHWETNLTSDANGQTTFTYSPTDDRSTYRIKVVAKDASGIIRAGQHSFSPK